MTEKLHQLQRLWLIEATKYNVLPLDDRGAERFDPDAAGRPQLVRGTSQMLFGGMVASQRAASSTSRTSRFR